MRGAFAVMSCKLSICDIAFFSEKEYVPDRDKLELMHPEFLPSETVDSKKLGTKFRELQQGTYNCKGPCTPHWDVHILCMNVECSKLSFQHSV